MKKWPFLLIIVLLLIFALAFFYPTYLSLSSVTGESINPVNKKQAAGIAVSVSIIVIGIIGYLTSRSK